MVLRNVVRINEDKCTGCGLCLPACAEGALRIVEGKARLISNRYCDGLGACLGECPVGAITIEKRDVEEFDEEAVKKHLLVRTQPSTDIGNSSPNSVPCSSIHIESGESSQQKAITELTSLRGRTSMLAQWPVQLALVPTKATFFENSHLLICADCVPIAYNNFHNDFLKNRKIVVNCPKLDQVEHYKEKLTEIFKQNTIRSITVVNMEVPCCFGLYRLVKEALDASGQQQPLKHKVISIQGEPCTSTSQIHEGKLGKMRSP